MSDQFRGQSINCKDHVARQLSVKLGVSEHFLGKSRRSKTFSPCLPQYKQIWYALLMTRSEKMTTSTICTLSDCLWNCCGLDCGRVISWLPKIGLAPPRRCFQVGSMFWGEFRIYIFEIPWHIYFGDLVQITRQNKPQNEFILRFSFSELKLVDPATLYEHIVV